MNNNPFDFQPTHTPQRSQQPPMPPRQPAQLNYSAHLDHSQQSHIQASQWTATPPPEQSALDTNYDYGSQWQRLQFQYQQRPQLSPQLAAQPDYNPCQPTVGYHHHYIPHPIASPQLPHHYVLPQQQQRHPHPHHPAVQSGSNPYQSTGGHHQHYRDVLHTVAYLQPQLPYEPQPQPQQQQQQKLLHHAPLQHLIPVKRQRLDDPDLNRRVQHHALPPPQPLFQLPLPAAQNTEVYPGQNQESGGEDELGGLNDAQPSANKEGTVGNRGGMSGGGGARGGSMPENRGGMAGRDKSGDHMDSNGGDGRDARSCGGVRAHGPRENFDTDASMQARGRAQFPNICESATVPVATQLEGAQSFTISGNPILTNIGMNTGVHNVNTVNNYGGTLGLERLEKCVSFAALYNSAAQDPERRCHPGTRKSVLCRLRHWIDNPNVTDRIFWLHGPAGAGKSAIAQTISHGYNQEEVVATFFFFRSDSGRNDGSRLFPTIAWQLAFSIPATKNFIIHALDKSPHLPTSDVETQFEQLVAHVFQRTNGVTSRMRHPAPVVIIDGIDECLDERLQRRFLVVIGNAVKDSRVPLRFLFSSRPEALIEETLNQFQDFTLRIDLATLDDSNRDIEKYLVDKFSVIASKQGLDPTWPGQEIIEEIVFKSSGNFILASTLIRFISDEDYSAESQLDIVRKLKPQGPMSPFALLDELYLEVLKRPRDQDFLQTFLGLLVGRSSVKESNLHEDDATLMNVPAKELLIKLRRMRSLLKLEPFIDVYHKSFLDFLKDSSRSGQYHVTEQGALKQYLGLIVDLVVRHVSMAVEQPNCHETCSELEFESIVRHYPPEIVLPVEDWQEALTPLMHLQDKLLNTSMPQSCHVTQTMRNLQLQLAVLQRSSHHIAAARVPGPNVCEAVTEWSPALVTEARQNIPEKDLDSCLTALLSSLQKPNSMLTVNAATIDQMSSLLVFDCAETAARVRSVSDAQKLVDLVDLMSNKCFFSQCGPDAGRKATFLTSEILARVPLLPASLFLNRSTRYIDMSRRFDFFPLELVSQSILISRVLDHNYIVPVSGMHNEQNNTLRFGNVTEQNESVDEWLQRSGSNLVTRMRVMLEVARIIRYIHSMDIILYSDDIRPESFFLDQNLHTKFLFTGFFAWWDWEDLNYDWTEHGLLEDCTQESNVFAFADLFDLVCFFGDEDMLKHYSRFKGDARQLMKRCRGKNPTRRPTMEDVVKEMEKWNLT